MPKDGIKANERYVIYSKEYDPNDTDMNGTNGLFSKKYVTEVAVDSQWENTAESDENQFDLYPQYDLVLQLADDPYGCFTMCYYLDEEFNYKDLSEYADANNRVSLTWDQLGITNDAWAKISFEDSYITKVLKCNCNKLKIATMENMFNDCSKLTYIDLKNFNTADVTDMSYMFNNCSSLTDIDLSNFDTKKVHHMGEMFDNCSKLTNINLSNFDTANVNFMDGLFKGCTSLTHLDLSNFTFKEGVNTTNMFKDCPAEINWGDNTPIN